MSPNLGSSNWVHKPDSSSHLLRVPLEVRYQIYRYILVSNLFESSRCSIYRPLGIDDNIFKIGYFKKDSVIPLLLVNRQIYNEAVGILYGENVFVFHVSGLRDCPIAFLDRIARRFIRLLRHVFVRTGFSVVTSNPFEADRQIVLNEGLMIPYKTPCSCVLSYSRSVPPHPPFGLGEDFSQSLLDSWVQTSATQLNDALPVQLEASVNTKDVIELRADCNICDLSDVISHYPRVSVGEFFFTPLWKMVCIAAEGDEPDREFRRIKWYKPKVQVDDLIEESSETV